MRNVTTTYRAGIWTESAVADLREASTAAGGQGRLNWEHGLYPLLLGEMTLEYYTQSSSLRDGLGSASSLRSQLVGAWHDGSFQKHVHALAGRLGSFEPRDHFRPDNRAALSSARDYHDFVRDLVARDLTEAEQPDGASPVKMSYEVLRFLRDPIRRAVEFGGLDAESHRVFFSRASKQITRLVAGPPAARARQLLALADAGVVTFPYGPAPQVEPDGNGGAQIQSSQLRRRHSEHVELAVRGYSETPVVHMSASPLVDSLHRRGRLCRLELGGNPVAGVELTRDSHPVNAQGEIQGNLWLFGAITEGTRYFNNCIPSPGSRRWSFEEALKCARQILT
jgi:hypothetical protein